MPQITSIEVQKKNPHRFNIFIDGQFAFGSDEDLIVEYNISSGKEITQKVLEKLIYEAGVGKLIERLYNLLSIRLRSEKEIRDYLKVLSFKRKIKGEEEISQSSVDLAITKLKNKGLINDLEFAKAWVEARRRSKQKGNRALTSELYQKGIDREIIEEVVSLQSSVVSEEELAKQALEKKLQSWKNLEPQEFKKKALGFLMRRGFDYQISAGVVAKIVKIR